jgi:hypothetical protein
MERYEGKKVAIIGGTSGMGGRYGEHAPRWTPARCGYGSLEGRTGIVPGRTWE